MASLFAALACLGLPGAPARAEEGPKALRCSFADGASQSFESGVFHSKASTPLSFDIDDIDLEQQTATLKAAPDAKPGKLSVVRAINANHYLEVVNEGFLNLTTVYDKDATTGRYPAVHSRHGAVLGSPMFGQYTGFCADQ
ncbi:hypothetical protein [Hyphomicrobium sp.]|uniref:hypothetical protein n=1 Tax=Hyphomicrobium sp. TaxID=82 RepID=UPI002FDDA09B